MDYLPKDATIEQACNWLQAKTGQTWILPRLLECHLTPHFWLDYKPGYPAIYGDRIEGYQTQMMFHGDICRLESDGGDALVNMFAAHDGSLIKLEPCLRVSLSDLRFKRERVERVAEITNNTAPAQTPATPLPLVAMEAQRGYVLALPSGQTHVQFGEMAHLIAGALWPDMGTNDTRMTYGCTRVNLDAELVQAVKSGALQVKDPLTFGRHTFPMGNALLSALVTVDDLREFVAGRGLTVETVQALAMTPSPAPVVTESASNGVQLDKARPLPVEQGLSTKDIAHAFDSVNGWGFERWRKNLSASKWLHSARIAIGGAGGASSVWNPLMLAQLMHDDAKGEREKEKLMKVFNSRFTLNPALGPWREDFNEYFATHCATD